LFVSRVKSAWAVIALWFGVVLVWFVIGFLSGELPLSEGGVRSPAEALLKFTRFAPCFLPGVVAYKLWRSPRFLPALAWPAFLVMCCLAFLRWSGAQPVEAGWLICFAIGLGVCAFRELPDGWLARGTKHIAKYSYGIYLWHYFAIWLGFAVCRAWNLGLRIFVAAATLISLSLILYHVVEAPLIRVGVRVSKMYGSRAVWIGLKPATARRAAEQSIQNRVC
jgi:peptidoglycan/LPS O-acetylase OafA/YrhL